MGHPLAPDLSKLTMEELNSKYNDLMNRYTTATRWGNAQLTQQLLMLIEDYRIELDNRQRKMLEDLEKNSKNFKNLIDIK